MKQLIFPLIILCLFPSAVFAWSLFGPNNYNDCLLYYQKKAKTKVAAYAINWACQCKFDGDYFTSHADICMQYSEKNIDCILKNVPDAQTDNAARSIIRACNAQE